MDFDEHIPIYLQIAEYVKVLIITGEAKSGEKILAVREMANALSTNPNTVQKAYQLLEAQGVIKSERGSGNYITKDESVIRFVKKDLCAEITDKYIAKMRTYGFDDREIIQIIEKKMG
ncbi:MAG: GntR family transcriptional regulator [Clostridiales bacterium]|nr:GntR family transcriptional regulator [Clostridiales bacterium]